MAVIDFLDLVCPGTTDAAKLAASDQMMIIFASYQSIQVIVDARQKHSLPAFDLIICDESHRTTRAALDGEDEVTKMLVLYKALAKRVLKDKLLNDPQPMKRTLALFLGFE